MFQLLGGPPTGASPWTHWGSSVILPDLVSPHCFAITNTTLVIEIRTLQTVKSAVNTASVNALHVCMTSANR